MGWLALVRRNCSSYCRQRWGSPTCHVPNCFCITQQTNCFQRMSFQVQCCIEIHASVHCSIGRPFCGPLMRKRKLQSQKCNRYFRNLRCNVGEQLKKFNILIPYDLGLQSVLDMDSQGRLREVWQRLMHR